nr:L,D-transpeptidase family protein [uncultured Cohaesibacter sp.]
MAATVLGDMMKSKGQLFLTAGFLLSSVSAGLATETSLEDVAGTGTAAEAVQVALENAGDEPIQIIVSRKDQRLKVYRGQEVIATSRVSTGKAGHSTPTGIFSILEKKRQHFSNIYDSAPMPYMQRLTWSGVALHESNSVPGYPASHGCVRLPRGFASELFSMTERGAHVIIANREAEPQLIESATLFQPENIELASKLSELSLGPVEPVKGHGKLELLSDKPSEDPLAAKLSMRLNLLDQVRQSKAPIRVFITRQPRGNLVREVQVMLNSLGFDAGEPDGLAGKATYTAVRAFIEARKGSIEANAEPLKAVIDKDLLAALYHAAGKGDVPTGHIYVRSNFKPLFDAPIMIKNPSQPLGVHLLTATHSSSEAGKLNWLSVNLTDRYNETMQSSLGLEQDQELGGLVASADVLDRIEIPEEVRAQIDLLVNSGSSITISDRGFSHETTPVGTDFIVLTKPDLPSSRPVKQASAAENPKVVKPKKLARNDKPAVVDEKPARKGLFSLLMNRGSSLTEVKTR